MSDVATGDVTTGEGATGEGAMSEIAMREGVPLRDFERSLPMALMRAREAVMRGFRPLLAEHDVSEQQWRVLRALDDADAPLSVGELADATFLLGPSLSRMLVKLGRHGLIERTSDPNDSRRSTIAIADAGRQLVDAIAPSSERRYAVIERHLGPVELESLYSLLDRLATTP